MLKVLLKKQFTEVFRGYFFDAKKNRMRSKLSVAAWFLFFFVIMVGVLGGMFTAMASSLCAPLTAEGMGWLYFLLMGGISILMGAFGSVFNTYSSLYLAKDNDLLLSMPIPVRDIVGARLLNVYLLGAMYSAVAILPALIVYWIAAGATAARVVCGVALFLIVAAVVLLLSTVLGWVVAKISLHVRNKSFVTVLVSLLFVAAYYFFYFKANDFIQDLLLHAQEYGARIKGAAYGLYLFGRVGEGDWGAAALFLAATLVCLVLIWIVLLRSFVSIVTSSGRVEKVRYVEKRAKERSAFGALLGKEFSRFAASPNYILNCGLGVLLLPAMGVLLLVKGREICEAIGGVFAAYPGAVEVLLCTALCLLSSMNDMATPSVSLEGKSLWIPQSLPLEPKTVLRAKACVQLILSCLPMLFAGVCAACIVDAPLALRALLCVFPAVYAAFSAMFGSVVGIKLPLLNWTDEIAPIKRSGAITIVLFGSWLLCVAFAGLYLFVGYRLGATVYLALCTALFAALALVLLRWLDTKGSRLFAAL